MVAHGAGDLAQVGLVRIAVWKVCRPSLRSQLGARVAGEAAVILKRVACARKRPAMASTACDIALCVESVEKAGARPGAEHSLKILHLLFSRFAEGYFRSANPKALSRRPGMAQGALDRRLGQVRAMYPGGKRFRLCLFAAARLMAADARCDIAGANCGMSDREA